MDRRKPNAKRQKRQNDESDGIEIVATRANGMAVDRNSSDKNDRNEIAAVAALDVEQTADIFKLNDDCFVIAFDYLPFKDLVSVGKTCKRLRQLAEYCLRQNYPQIQVRCGPKSFFSSNYITVTHLARSIRRIRILEKISPQFWLNVQSKRRQLNQAEIPLQQIVLQSIDITQSDVFRMDKTFNKVEALHLNWCDIYFREIIGHCSNLRQLRVTRCTTDLNWLNQKCATLDSFEYIPTCGQTESIGKILMFLEQNPNIQKFAVDADFMWTNRDIIKNASGIQLDSLAVQLFFRSQFEFAAFYGLLNELYARGFYRRLQIYICGITNQKMIDQLATVNGLVKLSMEQINLNVTLSALSKLEELCANNSFNIADMEAVANDLINLKRIHFQKAFFVKIMLFVRRSVALDKIKVDIWLDHGSSNFGQNPIVDLVKLNRAREQLPNARTITVYVKEEVYLATKRALKETNFPLIRLKRIESFEWNHNFS